MFDDLSDFYAEDDEFEKIDVDINHVSRNQSNNPLNVETNKELPKIHESKENDVRLNTE